MRARSNTLLLGVMLVLAALMVVLIVAVVATFFDAMGFFSRMGT